MSYGKVCILAVLLLGLPGFCVGILAQETLADLVAQEEQDEEDVEPMETRIPGLGDEFGGGRIRLPKGEEPRRLMISQDRPVDPEQYVLGPGDVLQLYIWGEFDVSYSLPVDPEGRVLIPTVGDFAVSDLTLAAVRRLVFAAAHEQYAGVEMTLNLAGMRFFSVFVTGAVPSQGAMSVHSATRVSEVIDLAGGFLDELRGTIGEEIKGGKTVTRALRLSDRPTSRRNITVTHRDAAVDTVDLGMFYATGDLRYNPYASMGDAVHVSYRLHEVQLYGPFHETGILEYREGDTIGSLIALVGGSRVTDPLEYVEVWRWTDETTEEYEIIPVATSTNPGTGIPADEYEGFPLQPKDMVFIRTRTEWQSMPTVTVNGQVRYAGRYRIVKGETRLRDVLEMAGGLTDRAALELATVVSTTHMEIEDPEFQRVRALKKTGDLSPDDEAYLKTKVVERRGRVVVDFVGLLNDGDDSQNILLQPGDAVYVPQQRQVVKVSGSVENPGLIAYVPGAGIDYYLDLAGWYTWSADRDEARLIRARTGVREDFDRSLVVEESDEIWVPRRPYRDWWKISTTAVNMAAQALTMVLIVTTIR